MLGEFQVHLPPSVCIVMIRQRAEPAVKGLQDETIPFQLSCCCYQH